jgi:hypothetical protein
MVTVTALRSRGPGRRNLLVTNCTAPWHGSRPFSQRAKRARASRKQHTINRPSTPGSRASIPDSSPYSPAHRRPAPVLEARRASFGVVRRWRLLATGPIQHCTTTLPASINASRPPATADGPSAGSSSRRRINQLCAAAIAKGQLQQTVQIGGYAKPRIRAMAGSPGRKPCESTRVTREPRRRRSPGCARCGSVRRSPRTGHDA